MPAPIALSDITGSPAQEVLEPLDADHDGRLEFNELLGQNLLTPSLASSVAIEKESDFLLYKRLVESAKATSGLWKFLDSYEEDAFRGREGRPAEEWVADEGHALLENPRLGAPWQSNSDLLDIAPFEDGFELLFESGRTQNHDRFFFTVNLNRDPCENSVLVGDLLFQLDEFLPAPALEDFRKQLLKDLYVTLTVPLTGLPNNFRHEQRDRIEALMIQANPDLISVYKQKDTAENTTPSPELKKRVAQSLTNVMPLRKPLCALGPNACLPVPLRSETPLSAAERSRLEAGWAGIPDALIKTAVMNGVISNEAASLSLEVVEKDILKGMGFNWAGALYHPSLNKIFLSRSYLNNARETYLARLLIHELAHSLNSRIPNFFDAYFLDVRAQLNEKANPAVTPYALNAASENFAENVVAYFVGEEDNNPGVCATCGPVSRAELRQKQPEMYVAIKLFFDESSPVFGEPSVFSHESKRVIDRLLDDRELKDRVLSPETSPAKIHRWYKMASREEKIVADVFDLHRHDPYYGYYNHRYVYEGLDLDGDVFPERLLINEITRFDQKKQKWTATFTAVLLKWDNNNMKQHRLTNSITLSGPLLREDFLKRGLQPVYRGLYLGTAENTNRKYLHIRTRLDEDVILILNQNGSRPELTSTRLKK